MSFTSVEARAALVDLLSAFQSPTNLPGLEAARAEAGNDMVKQMQLVFPAVTRIQAQVISRYAFMNILFKNIYAILWHFTSLLISIFKLDFQHGGLYVFINLEKIYFFNS